MTITPCIIHHSLTPIECNMLYIECAYRIKITVNISNSYGPRPSCQCLNLPHYCKNISTSNGPRPSCQTLPAPSAMVSVQACKPPSSPSLPYFQSSLPPTIASASLTGQERAGLSMVQDPPQTVHTSAKALASGQPSTP